MNQAPRSHEIWRFWIDRGGTFTDIVARRPDGTVATEKLLSDNPQRYDDAATEGIYRLTGKSRDEKLPHISIRMGTTVATNALLERTGRSVLLAVTKGFGDALSIGYQARPDLFARQIVKPPPVYADVLEIDERVSAAGEVLVSLDEAAAREGFAAAYEKGLRSTAILCMHGFAHPAHERRLAEIAAEVGFSQISVSHDVSALIKFIGRGDTTVIDAYLSPVLRSYIERLTERLGDAVSPLFMQSNGGLAAARSFRGKDAILSGPAGGIVGMARTAEQAGYGNVIGFDMGGTSTDVSHYAGGYELSHETEIAGARIRAPMMAVHTVAAGGGSLCWFDGARFLVGPQSAGAVPGPACYRRGGPLTVTDCNLLLGKIDPAYFPAVFGAAGDEPLDRSAAEARMAEVLADMKRTTGRAMESAEAARGFIDIAVANMANAIKRISVGRGRDVTRYTLACFGGAGGQHACLVAEALGMSRVMIHPHAGVLSAYGMRLADRRASKEATLGLALSASREIEAATDRLASAALAELGDLLPGEASSETEIHLSLRYEGTDHGIEVPYGAAADMRAAFEVAHRAQFGFVGDAPLIVDMARAEAIAVSDEAPATVADTPSQSAAPLAMADYEGTGMPVYNRAGLAAGFHTAGPVLIIDPLSTTMVEPDWQVDVTEAGNLVLTSTGDQRSAKAGIDVDPIRLEIFNGLFMAIAEEMGAALQHSASSINIRERLDFSCALFSADGALVANAPHMPVHLGSMGASVSAVLSRHQGDIRPGDVFALNDPYAGGTHLPDITVIMPVFLPDMEAAPAYWVAARGHHADVGGIAPGSMPPGSRTIDEEGVLFDNIHIVAQGNFQEDAIRALLQSGTYPARNPAQNIADLKAQVAACARGANELRRVAGDYGREVLDAYMGHVQDHAEHAVERLLSRMTDGHLRYELDSGAAIEVAVRIEGKRATVDFTGTSDQLDNNFNAPFAVVRAAVLYVVRTLVDEAIPMNDGCLRPIDIIVPEGSMLRPRPPAAVVAGNVETSQAICDALFGALGAMAAAQGTMNNLTFGNDDYQYYETIAGGSGAGPHFDGTDAVQTHMTNSRLTDPEILETRCPVLLEEFSIRRGSGGAGRHKGGDGVVRRIRFLEKMQANLLANRRRVPPFGLAGGDDAAAGTGRVERVCGTVEVIGGTGSADLSPGDVFVIETPGGGGYGKGR
ncbi:hydantoinase B/oxoprolinase family protein [Pacificimonas sp. WHA3]|uniref:Hydantoinase B/oxoprolinase family protein n=1 Tax=Pacificimonas pallii TaxID=2827236 RepID=A0ABS6SHC8_9SPHN|nr:hydantoinase B/oxoprolinase family protein [Pacificimonas pallii]MBV7257751.1 hydantoinase B/oxoprolinase family protein [Pacificimonas pallii]